MLQCFDGELLESRFEQLQLPNYFLNDWQPDDQTTREWILWGGVLEFELLLQRGGRQQRLDGVLWNKDKRACYKIMPGNQCYCIPGH